MRDTFVPYPLTRRRRQRGDERYAPGAAGEAPGVEKKMRRTTVPFQPSYPLMPHGGRLHPL